MYYDLFINSNPILNRKIYEYSQIITLNLNEYLLSKKDDFSIMQRMNSYPKIREYNYSECSEMDYYNHVQKKCPGSEFMPGNNKMNIQQQINSYPKIEEYNYSEGNEEDYYNHIQNKMSHQILQNLSLMLMMEWPFHVFPWQIDYKYEDLFNEELNVSLDEFIQYQQKMNNNWIKYDYHTLTIDPLKYLMKLSSEEMRKNVIQRKFKKIMNTLYPHGINSGQISNIFKYFIGILPTKQQIEYGTDLCDKSLNMEQKIHKLKLIHRQNIHNENEYHIMNPSIIKQHVLSYEEMIACAVYHKKFQENYLNGITITQLKQNLQTYFKLNLDFSNPFCKALLHELVDPNVRRRDGKYLLGRKSRNRLTELLDWWRNIIDNCGKKASKPRFSNIKTTNFRHQNHHFAASKQPFCGIKTTIFRHQNHDFAAKIQLLSTIYHIMQIYLIWCTF